MPVITFHNPNTVTGDGDQRFLTETLLNQKALEDFKRKNVFWNSMFIQMKTLARGQSVERFKIRGDSPEDAEHHVRGALITSGTRVNTNADVEVDDDLIKSLAIPFVDAQLSKYDEVAPDQRECVRIISEKMDKRIARLITLAARTAAVTNVHGGGNRVLNTGGSTVALNYPATVAGGLAFSADASALAQGMDEDDVPDDGNRYLFISPLIRNALTKSGVVMNKDYANPGNISLERRIIGQLESFKLVLTNHIPTATVSNDLSKYNLTVGLTAGIPAALALYNAPGEQGAIGGVHSAGLMRNKVWFDEDYNVTKIKSQVFAGMDVVAPWMAGEIAIVT